MDVPFGKPPVERADAARNREALLCTARAMIAELGVDRVTMDGLAERAGLGKGTVFRRFGTRAGIFRALLDAEEQCFQAEVLSGEPPLGPGADPVDRLIAYGRERTRFLLARQDIARAGVERKGPVTGGGPVFTQPHIRMLLGQAGLGLREVDTLAFQLTSALEGPPLVFLAMDPAVAAQAAEHCEGELGASLMDSWQELIERLAGR